MSGRIPPAVRDFWWLGAGYLFWSAAFALLYALLSFGCAFGWEDWVVGPTSFQRVILSGAWLGTVAIAAALVWLSWTGWKRSGRDSFVRLTSLALSVTALAVTVANFAPVTMLSACL